MNLGTMGYAIRHLLSNKMRTDNVNRVEIRMDNANKVEISTDDDFKHAEGLYKHNDCRVVEILIHRGVLFHTHGYLSEVVIPKK